MLDRFTVSSLIKSVIVLMALCMTALLGVSAWNSRDRLAMTDRILVVTDASSLRGSVHDDTGVDVELRSTLPGALLTTRGRSLHLRWGDNLPDAMRATGGNRKVT